MCFLHVNAFCRGCCWVGALLTLWTNNIKIKAIKLQADFNDRQSSISERSRCRCLCLAADIVDSLAVVVVVDIVVVVAAGAIAVVVVVVVVVDFRRKCFLNILYILCAFLNVFAACCCRRCWPAV